MSHYKYQEEREEKKKKKAAPVVHYYICIRTPLWLYCYALSSKHPMSNHLNNLPIGFTAPKAIPHLCYLKSGEGKLGVRAARASGRGHVSLDMTAVHRSAILDQPDSWGCRWQAPPRTRADLLTTTTTTATFEAVRCVPLFVFLGTRLTSLTEAGGQRGDKGPFAKDKVSECCLSTGYFSRKTSFNKK